MKIYMPDSFIWMSIIYYLLKSDFKLNFLKANLSI